MQIAIISDSHDNLANLKRAVSFIEGEKIKTVIHCGDICAPATLKEAFKDFKGKVEVVFGNVDGDTFRLEKVAEELTKIRIHGELGEIVADKKKIAFTHFPDFARGLAVTKKYDLVCYGHSHKPWEETPYQSKHGTRQGIGNTKLLNPGNLAGLFYKATFAVYDTKNNNLELKILEKL